MLLRGRQRRAEGLLDEQSRLISAFVTAQSPKALRAWSERERQRHPMSVAEYSASKARLRGALEARGAYVQRVH